jgi:coenzyme PQQ precursor peptide PqqA
VERRAARVRRTAGAGASRRDARRSLVDTPRAGPVRFSRRHPSRRSAMAWETPSFVEIRMDAELTAYADDLGAA